MRELNQDDLEDLLNGATILGSGGGGPMFVGEQAIKDFLEGKKSKGKKLPCLVDPKDLAPTDLMAVVAGVGSPAAAENGFPMGIPIKAFDTLAERQNVEYQALLSVELGAGNSFVPLYVAWDKGLPMVDASGARRAVPALTQCTFADLPISPLVMVNEGNEVILEVADAAAAAQPMRAVLSTDEFAQDAGIAFWPMNAQTMREAAVHGTVSTAIEVGAVLRAAKDEDPVEAVRSHLNGHLLFTGKVAAIEQVTSGGFDLGRITIKNSSDELTIYNQNENLIAYSSKKPHPLAIGPDLICYLATDGNVFSNAEIGAYTGDGEHADQEVAIIGVAATEPMRSDKVVAAFLASLRAIGYGGPYVKIEDLVKTEWLVDQSPSY